MTLSPSTDLESGVFLAATAGAQTEVDMVGVSIKRADLSVRLVLPVAGAQDDHAGHLQGV